MKFHSTITLFLLTLAINLSATNKKYVHKKPSESKSNHFYSKKITPPAPIKKKQPVNNAQAILEREQQKETQSHMIEFLLTTFIIQQRLQKNNP